MTIHTLREDWGQDETTGLYWWFIKSPDGETYDSGEGIRSHQRCMLALRDARRLAQAFYQNVAEKAALEAIKVPTVLIVTEYEELARSIWPMIRKLTAAPKHSVLDTVVPGDLDKDTGRIEAVVVLNDSIRVLEQDTTTAKTEWVKDWLTPRVEKAKAPVYKFRFDWKRVA